MLYNNAYIYKIHNPVSANSYYGSTTKAIGNRFKQHRDGYSKYKTGSGNYIASYKLFDDFNIPTIEIMQTLTNVTKQQILQCERSYIENNSCINKNIPIRTYAEKLQYARDYHKNHFDTINNRKNEKLTCENCHCSVSRTNITHHYKSQKHRNNI